MRPVVIKSFLLSKFSEIVHGFSTKVGSVNDFNFNIGNTATNIDDEIKRNREIFFNSLGINKDRVAYQQQVHSDKFTIVEKPELIHENDALITSKRNLFLVVTVADCIPILFYDKTNQIVGVIHSGWRGTYNQIVKKTIHYAISNLSLDRENTFFYFGPSICSQCFEVDEDVAMLFNSKFVKKKEKKFTVNLPKINFQYLLELGIKESNIQISHLCTFELKNLFHSYRRDKKKSGRMFGVIGISSNEK